MSNQRRPLIAGNWKMNGLAKSAGNELLELVKLVRDHKAPNCDILICPPATLVREMAKLAEDNAVDIGGQDCHAAENGAHTGDISAEMLKDAGAGYCIVGHSERRADHGETNAAVKAKAEAALRANMIAVVCVGETLDEREADKTLDVISDQVKNSLPEGATAANTVIAYEPVWAIGTGKTPTPLDVAVVHAHIRSELGSLMNDSDQVRLLYGGSVKGSNAEELMAVENVDGALVGGASLKAADFWPIVATSI
ncbi:triose-phosphate isomerase [Sneathiella litorea]|uniref:Triosephosphate isomerase n=1 Tax=Sneathiella litorea TaxID=2606216 RepID=A0A6L8W5Q2_9PROT|nr:triose-phosphate isomerase [Sneathiella litorea]MZR30465.1 triose-phosphate isomerase [Sneathiella litorea]